MNEEKDVTERYERIGCSPKFYRNQVKPSGETKRPGLIRFEYTATCGTTARDTIELE